MSINKNCGRERPAPKQYEENLTVIPLSGAQSHITAWGKEHVNSWHISDTFQTRFPAGKKKKTGAALFCSATKLNLTCVWLECQETGSWVLKESRERESCIGSEARCQTHTSLSVLCLDGGREPTKAESLRWLSFEGFHVIFLGLTSCERLFYIHDWHIVVRSVGLGLVQWFRICFITDEYDFWKQIFTANWAKVKRNPAC